MATTRVLLVEDHELLAQSVGMALQAESMQVEVAELDDPDALVASVQREPPDVVLVDLELGGAIGDGTSLVAPFTRAGSRVLAVTAVTDRTRLAAALEQGAVGVVSKSLPFQVLLESVLTVARGEDVMSPAQRHTLLGELRLAREAEQARLEPFERLTVREQQVLHALGQGKSVSHIAEEWVVSEATVRTQVRGVLMKLGVTSQLEAVAQALRVGWLKSAE